MKSIKKFLVQMNREEARDFLLKKSSYFSHNLPSYFNLQYLLEKALDILGQKVLNNLFSCQSSPLFYKTHAWNAIHSFPDF